MFNWRNKKRNLGGLKSNATVVLTSCNRKPHLKGLFSEMKNSMMLHASHIQVSYISKVLTKDTDLYKD